jgi:gamma-glutamyltranspeptidase / glutathione hydrolase
VAAGRSEEVIAGILILEQGGNSADTAAATILALTVTDYGLCTIGAEVPRLIYDATTGHVKVLCGQGGAPLSPEVIQWYYQNGIPDKGGIKAAAVPEVVSLAAELLKSYGAMSFELVAGPMLALLDAGG